MTARKTKILLDGGDAQETQRIMKRLGFLDGQTTNPSLIAKNPDIKRFVASDTILTMDWLARYCPLGPYNAST
jgi:transaldolase